MRSGKRYLVICCALALAIAARAQLQSWVQHVPAGPLIGVFFRSVPMPGGAVEIRRPPEETIPALAQKIGAAPKDAGLYRLRASEEELALDFAAAEADWRKYAELASDRGAANLELADYFHRRLQARDEVQVLEIVAQSAADPLVAPQRQRSWQAFERMLSVIDDQDLPDSMEGTVFRAWMARYPKESDVRGKYISYLVDDRQYAAAQTQIAAYQKAFPEDNAYPTEARARIALQRGSTNEAIAVYDRAFQPLWPVDLDKAYFGLLDREGRLREFSGRARTSLQANPADFEAAARLFHYFAFQNNTIAARRVLVELRLAKEARKQAWTAEELLTLARLSERTQDINEAARYYYALYSLPGAAPSYAEKALGGLAELLFANAGQGLRFGSGDLSFYRDIASVDTSPGFFNGILSLVLNSTTPRWAYQQENQTAGAYFQRARAADLVDVFDRRFPRSPQRTALHASLIRTYAAYGDDVATIRFGRAFMASFAKAPQRQTIGLLMADAYARQNKKAEEFAIYDQLLREAAAQAQSVPIGENGGIPAPAPVPTPQFESPQPTREVPSTARSTEYAAVLDRYLTRLAAVNRPMDALRVYRREIDRNPNDPGLYERLAGFLDQHSMGQDVESVYRRAIGKFPDRSWYDRLARWYLRQKQAAAFETLTREVVGVFSGTELENYFAQVVEGASVGPALYLQLNTYAHQRFPEDMAFVHNLLAAYSRTDTHDPAAAERLLRQYWFYDRALRIRLFEELSESGRLYAEIAAIRTQNPGIAAEGAQRVAGTNPAAAQFSAEAEAWLSHFEAAAPEMRALAEEYPGQTLSTGRASAIYRSLAAFDPANTDIAASLAEAEYRSGPRDRDVLAKIGDIYSDRERFDRARVFWNRMPRIDPGKTDGYLEAATVFWDYYRYADALRIIRQARGDFDDPTLFAFEAGAIYENERDYPRAVHQYIAGALADNTKAEQRLLRLATRAGLRDVVTTAANGITVSSEAAVTLRAAILDAQQHRPEIATLLLAQVDSAHSASMLAKIADLAATYGLDTVQERAMEQRIAVTSDPLDKMRLRIDLAKFYERKLDTPDAARAIDELYRANPLILGVVRASVDFYARNRQPERAITILLEASARARRDLANQFTLEAANLATNAGQLDRARTLLGGLLRDDPYSSEYLTAMAATYSKAQDDRGLRDYQLATIEALKNAPMPVAERTERIAELRRSLIPALTRLNDFTGGADQYIEVLNRYPEDESLAREAALYAGAHNRTAQLLDFYRKTIAEAPRDYRWPILLGRLETYAEDYPAAIAAYDLAMKARPDRADVVEARAQLEERLLRFDDAARSYARLYELTYRDPQWMEKIAELRAREQRPDEAVAALKIAVIGARSQTADADFAIARKLESWNLVSEAVPFAENGAKLAGKDLATGNGLGIYATVMTRARRIEPVLDLILASAEAQSAAQAAGAAVAQYYTPEEKAALEKTLVSRNAAGLLARPAGPAGLQARASYEAMMKPEARLDLVFIQLQRDRSEYEELGRQLESFAAVPQHAAEADTALVSAADAYIADANGDAQLRVMRKLRDRGSLSGSLLDRYLGLLAASHRDELMALIRGTASNEIRNRAVQFSIASGTEPVALQAVEARGGAFPAVWTGAYKALTGLYYSDPSAAINAAFTAVLDTRTIGERVRLPFDRDRQLAGNVWFYYGARYGEYLDLTKRPGGADYLPATVEQSPGDPEAYLALGDYYAGTENVAKAITEFKAVLQLDADRGDAHDHIARLLWSHGRQDDAVAEWRAAMAAFLHQESRGGRVPEPFWGRVIECIHDIGHAHAAVELRPDVDRLLSDYANRNGTYRLNEILEAAFTASVESGQNPAWLIAMAANTEGGEWILESLLRLPQLTDGQKVQVQRALIALMQRSLGAGRPEEREYREANFARKQVDLVGLLLDARDIAAANAEWAQIGATKWEENDAYAQQIHIRLAAVNDTLAQLLESWRSGENIHTDTLRRAAISLSEEGREDAARAVLEFMYRRELSRGDVSAANFLGLAGVLLDRGDTSGAVAQLRRMVLVTPDPFDTFIPAAELLADHGKNAEAAQFARERARAVPWDAAAKLRLLKLDASQDRSTVLTQIAADSGTSYPLRIEAARMLAPQSSAALNGTELGLLARGRISPASAGQPYYVEARMVAAENVSDPALRLSLLREALAIAPQDNQVRLAATRAALDGGRDGLALAMYRSAVLAQLRRSNEEASVLAERLGDAAERLDDLNAAIEYLRSAIDLRPRDQRAPLESKLKRIEGEQNRRAQNAARQPVVKNVVDQATVVRPRIAGGAQ